jgi:uncharacterized protein (DUF1330 family)
MDDAPQLKHKYGRIDKDYAMALATRAPEDDSPIYMVNLMKYHEVAQYTADASVDKPISGREADDRYNPASILAKIGANMMLVGDVVKSHVGSENWDRIAVVRYPSRKSFIDMQSRKDFSEKHVHKAAGMQRTIIVCCRPQDLSLDTRGRPQAADDRHIVMIVRRTSDRVAAFAAVPNAVNLTAEGTIIGDGRAWDTVQFVPIASANDAESLAKSVTATADSDIYVMTVRASMDAITQG